MEHVVILNPRSVQDGLLNVVEAALSKDGLKSIRRRIVLIEQKKAFIMEGTAAHPHKRPLGKVPKTMEHISGRCYVYQAAESGENELNIANTMSQMTADYGRTYISQSVNEFEKMYKVLFG